MKYTPAELERFQCIRWRAYARLQQALREGEITRPDKCSVCGEPGKVDFHHYNYLALDGAWLCRSCHRKEHGRIRRAERKRIAAAWAAANN